MNKRWIIIFILATSFLWAQEIRPISQNVPLCEIEIRSESLFMISMPNPPTIIVKQPTQAYNEPTYESQPIYLLKTSDTFLIQGINENWYKISLPDGEIGWVLNTYVTEKRMDDISDAIKNNVKTETIIKIVPWSKLIGKILYVADSSIVFWKTYGYYNKYQTTVQLIKLKYFDIEKISLVKKNPKINPRALSTLIGGSAGGCLGFTIGFVKGKSEGDDPGDPDWPGMSAETKGVLYGTCLGSIGFGIGSLVGITTRLISSPGKSRNYQAMIYGNYKNYELSIIRLRQNSIFPVTPPSELRQFLEK